MKKIEFFSSVPGLVETFPIVAAKHCLPDWIAYAKADYNKKEKHDLHIMRCPGIVEVLASGYIIKAWHDFNLTCTEDNITVHIPNRAIHDLLGRETIQIQSHHSIAKFFPERPWSQRSILKINTPWQVFAPKGVKFMMIPLPYNEQMLFESCIGILDPALSTELNIQGYWNSGIGTQTIKAGTPLVQLVPLTDKTYDFVVRDMTERDEKWIKISSYLNMFSFSFNRGKMREAYNSFIK
jgi:hypothetical protein